MSADSKTAVVRSYAKVNLSLDVLGRRPDGFHSVESVIQTISLHDTLTLSVGGEPGIRLACGMPGVPTDEANLAHKAASLFFEESGVSTGLDIHIQKRIPPEAGLGGGSSNAAAVLRGLGLLGFPMGQAELMSLAAQIGSDVPFFLIGGTALVRGRGENVTPLPDIPTQWLVIVKPPFGVSTAWAYQRLDEVRAASRQQPAISTSERPPTNLHNDLELPVIERHPEIGGIKSALIEAGAQGALMCGSGSAVFGLFEMEDEARAAADRLKGQDMGDLFTAKTITHREALEIG